MATFLGNRIYEGIQRLNKELLLKETTAPSATDGYGSLYVQSDGYLYYKDFNGTQTDLVNVTVTPAGSDREIQFNDAGAFGASSSLTLSASNELTVDGYTYLNSGLAVSGNEGISGDLTVSGNIYNTNLQNTLDGYASNSTENWRWAQSAEQRQNIRDALDGYSTLTTAEGADGYIAFFTGSNSMAGDNDLFYNRATGDLTLGSGGSLSISKGVEVGADGYANLEVTGQAWSNLPGQLSPTGQDTTIDLSEGNARVLNLKNATGAFTVTLTNMQAGATYVIEIHQHASSPVTVSFSNSVLYEGGSAYSATQSNSAVDFVTLFYNGTDFIGSYLLNLS